MGLFGGGNSSSANINQPTVTIGGPSGYGQGSGYYDEWGIWNSAGNDQAPAPVSPFSDTNTFGISTSGAGSTVSATSNKVNTSNIDNSGSSSSGAIISNVNVGGSLNLTDFGATHDALAFAGQTIDQAGNLISEGVGSAFKFADNSYTNALKFASGVAQGYALQTAEQEKTSFAAVQQAQTQSYNLVQGTISGIGNLLSSSISNLKDSNAAALAFFGDETAQLQKATTQAIDTVALRTSSENAQGLAGLQDTFTKVAIGMGVVIVAIAFFMSKHR